MIVLPLMQQANNNQIPIGGCPTASCGCFVDRRNGADKPAKARAQDDEPSPPPLQRGNFRSVAQCPTFYKGFKEPAWLDVERRLVVLDGGRFVR